MSEHEEDSVLNIFPPYLPMVIVRHRLLVSGHDSKGCVENSLSYQGTTLEAALITAHEQVVNGRG